MTKKILFVIRLIITLILILPSLPLLYLVFTCFGLFLIVPLSGILGMPFNILIQNSEGFEESKEMAIAGLWILAKPFIFWWHFVCGRNPFKELEDSE